MSIEICPKNHIVQIESKIDYIEIKGQYIHLAAPIYLTGELKVSELLAEYQINIQQSVDQVSLQVGVDEAGRGPLLGSVTVAAAILPNAWSGLIEEQPLQNTPLAILTDSKKLSEKKRDMLYPLIQQHARGYIVADIPAAVIDQVNILQATMLGMRLCTEVILEAVASHLYLIIEGAGANVGAKAEASSMLKAKLLFDGNRCPELDYAKLATVGIAESAVDCQAWVKGDARHTSIAAASILAKVSRDKMMYKLDVQCPHYGIAQHKGYPTKAHMQAINDYGVLPDHRRSFAPVRKALAEND